MARQGAKPAARPRRERGATVSTVITAIRLLVEKPRTPTELTEQLELSRNTVHRLINAFEAAGLPLEVERDGVFAYYRLPRELLRKKLGV